MENSKDTDVIRKFRKKPVEIEAVQFTGLSGDNWEFCDDFTKGILITDSDNFTLIPTLEGYMKVSPGDWIIKGIHGEFYPCKPDIFTKTYEEIK